MAGMKKENTWFSQSTSDIRKISRMYLAGADRTDVMEKFKSRDFYHFSVCVKTAAVWLDVIDRREFVQAKPNEWLEQLMAGWVNSLGVEEKGLARVTAIRLIRQMVRMGQLIPVGRFLLHVSVTSWEWGGHDEIYAFEEGS